MVSAPEIFIDNISISPGPTMIFKECSAQVKKYLYNWIVQHPQVVQSPISNDCIKVCIDGHSEPHLFPKLLLKFSVR